MLRVLLLVALISAYLGGWAAITVEAMPALFVAKGCVTCHVHGDIEGSGTVAVGPELTGRRWPAEYLKLFLANPAIAPRSGTFRMPDLGLKPQEIAALAAFLNAEHQALQ